MTVWWPVFGAPAGFDHTYAAYAEVLRRHVTTTGVDYAALKADRADLDRAVIALGAVTAADELAWTREQRLAYWINAYNLFTLRAIIDHYPIQSGWLTVQPRNSIRQIDGVWTRLQWRAAGRLVTLDDIEHRIVRPGFGEPRIHFAVNCASVSCPPLAVEPYRADRLEAQLDAAARGFLTSAEGVRLQGERLLVSSLLKWYGDDFIARYAPFATGGGDQLSRAILGVVITHGPPETVAVARSGRARIGFLDYDWSLNDRRR